MRSNLMACLTALVVFSVLPGAALAHHGGAAYDTSKMTTVIGTVTDFQFTNPHIIISMDVKDSATGKIDKWQGELTSPNHLSRMGWTKDTIKVGDELTMTGSALKTGGFAMAIRKIMRNGEQISTNAG